MAEGGRTSATMAEGGRTAAATATGRTTTATATGRTTAELNLGEGERSSDKFLRCRTATHAFHLRIFHQVLERDLNGVKKDTEGAQGFADGSSDVMQCRYTSLSLVLTAFFHFMFSFFWMFISGIPKKIKRVG
ncbi:hypothetical protein ACS0TY_006967 [Phlomoides rotata]